MQRNPLNDNDVSGNTVAWMADQPSLYEQIRQGCQSIVEGYLMNKEMRFKDFQDYLAQVFAEGAGSTVLDDMFIDSFNDWIQDLDIEDLIKYADKYANIYKNHGK